MGICYQYVLSHESLFCISKLYFIKDQGKVLGDRQVTVTSFMIKVT